MLFYWALGKLSSGLSRCSSFYARREDAVWSWVHLLVAPIVCGQLVSLKSVFVKFGQYLGGRADIVPPEWAASLRLLQDELPACPPRYLRRTVSEAFGDSVDKLFVQLDERPIASASVAQVHVGRLRQPKPKLSSAAAAAGSGGVETTQESAAAAEEGVKIVLKLQHDGVEPLMKDDMVACLRLAGFAKWLNSDFNAMYMVLESWQVRGAREGGSVDRAMPVRTAG